MPQWINLNRNNSFVIRHDYLLCEKSGSNHTHDYTDHSVEIFTPFNKETVLS